MRVITFLVALGLLVGAGTAWACPMQNAAKDQKSRVLQRRLEHAHSRQVATRPEELNLRPMAGALVPAIFTSPPMH